MTRRQRIADLTAFALPSQPALSPDGREVVYVLTTVDAAADKNVSCLWRVTVPAAGGQPGTGSQPGTGRGGTGPDSVSTNHPSTGHPSTGHPSTGHPSTARRLTRGTADFAPAWSPDGTRLAFLRADGGPAQLWLLPAGGGEPEQLTSLPLGAGAPVWSPDGTKIAFGAPVDLRGDARRGRRGPGAAGRRAGREHPDRRQGRRGRAAAHHPQAPARPRPGQRPGPPGDRGRLARRRPGLVTRLGAAGVRRGDRARQGPALPRPGYGTATCPAGSPSRGRSRWPTGSALPAAWTPTAPR